MRAEKRWHCAQMGSLTYAPNDAENLQFIFDGEPIAGLRFNRCGSTVKEPPRMARCGCKQLVFSCGTRLADGRANAAAQSGNLLVGDAGAALLELVGAIACKDRVRVGIDEAGRYQTYACVDYLGVLC